MALADRHAHGRTAPPGPKALSSGGGPMKRWNAVLVGLVGVYGLALSGLVAMVLWSTPNLRHAAMVFREPALGRE